MERRTSIPLVLLINAFLPVSASVAAEYWDFRPSIPTVEDPQGYRFSTLSRPPIDEIKLGRLAIRLEATRIEDVAKSIGVGIAGSKPGGSWLCYFWKDRYSTHQLWLETATLSEKVGTLIVKAEPPPSEAACSELPPKFRDVRFLGLRLSLSLRDATKAFPQVIPGTRYVDHKGPFEFVYRSCEGNGTRRDGALYIEWRYPDYGSIYQLVAQKDTSEC